MIGFLRGKLVKKQAPLLLVEVHGVGYEVSAPMTTFYDLPALGDEVLLHTHLLVREDAQQLYGFIRENDRDMFRVLLKVNGVGAKMALALMSGMSVRSLASALERNDVDAFTHIPGIGKKTAARLVVELRDRLSDMALAESSGSPSVSAEIDPVADAVSALIALGYKPQEASKMVRAVDDSQQTSDSLVRLALRNSVMSSNS